jgi:hypothetical protein
MPVRYFGGLIDVQLGDRVDIGLWFRRRSGRIVYVPGVSPFNSEFEYNGMKWVGIRLATGSLVATVVRSDSEMLKKKVQFLARDNSPCEFITSSSKEFEEHGEGPAL